MKKNIYFLVLFVFVISGMIFLPHAYGQSLSGFFTDFPKNILMFTKTLVRGVKNTEVSTLQECLKKDPSIYPDGLVTGFFGSLTEKAVQRFQIREGIISSGSPDTTGFGLVGPKTRIKLIEFCLIKSADAYLKSDAGKSTQVQTENAPTVSNAQTEIKKFFKDIGVDEAQISSEGFSATVKDALLEVESAPLDTSGPGNCKTLKECRTYCLKPQNINSCYTFILNGLK